MNFSKYIVSLFIFLIVTSPVVNAQSGFRENNLLSGIRIFGNIGFSQMITEVPSDFSGFINEFEHNPGLSFNLELAKQLAPRWETGGIVSLSTLNGKTEKPEFSAIGNHASMNNLRNEPIVFSNNQNAYILMVRYSLHNIQTRNYSGVNPFFQAGVGIVSHVAELKYENSEKGNLIFGKAMGNFSENSVSNAVYMLGVGGRFKLTPKTELFAAFNTKFVGYDFLDVVHNYNESGDRLNVVGIYSELTLGLSFLTFKPFYAPGKRKMKKVKQNHLPFFYR